MCCCRACATKGVLLLGRLVLSLQGGLTFGGVLLLGRGLTFGGGFRHFHRVPKHSPVPEKAKSLGCFVDTFKKHLYSVSLVFKI